MKTIILIAALLAGCASPQSPVLREGNENTAVVNWYWSTSGASGSLKVADQHCSHYGKHAQFVANQAEFDLAYNCVK